MPTEYASDIVNAIFAGKKDLSTYVDSGMKQLAMNAIDAKKKEVGAQMFAPEPEESEEESPETPAAETETETEEEQTDDTDQGGD